MINLENAYNQALELLQKGHSKEEVLLAFPEHQKELSPLLDISLTLSTLPKNLAPEPAMQRKYVLVPAKSVWLAWLHVSKFAGVSVSLMLLVSTFTFTALASLRSGPGQVLFSVKKTTEKLQLILAYNQDQKANLQVQITQKRLNEAREIFSNPNSDPKQEQAALLELSSQTSDAVAIVSTVTKSNPQSEKNNPLLNTLESITKDQQNLLTEINDSSEVQVEAGSAQQTLNENSAKISEIKQFVAIASNEQALASLKSDPNSVALLGSITKISKNEITVEETSFTINSQTVAKDAEGKTISITDLKQKTKVNIVGIKNTTGILAQQILITASVDPETTVKGASTSTIPTISSKPASTTLPGIKKPVEEEAPTTTPINPNQAVGSFILEDPAPQFSGK